MAKVGFINLTKVQASSLLTHKAGSLRERFHSLIELIDGLV
jgi:hypothetical protein